MYAFENYLPPTAREWLDAKLRELRVMLVENGILAAKGGAGSESKAVTDARKRRDAAQSDLDQMHTDLQSHRDDLARDFGADDVFRALQGTCIRTDSGEYTYEVCFMESTTQLGKKGRGSMGLGSFQGFERVTVDDELPADGKGLGSGERVAMKFDHGQHCWNGPNRSSMVVMACAEANEIWKIVEEEKCVYRLEMGTPAVCEEDEEAEKTTGAKDEL